jgi:hypothetical protein
MLLTVRTLIEQLAHRDGDELIATRKYLHGIDRVTLNFIEENEVDFEMVYREGEDKLTVILG